MPIPCSYQNLTPSSRDYSSSFLAQKSRSLLLRVMAQSRSLISCCIFQKLELSFIFMPFPSSFHPYLPFFQLTHSSLRGKMHFPKPHLPSTSSLLSLSFLEKHFWMINLYLWGSPFPPPINSLTCCHLSSTPIIQLKFLWFHEWFPHYLIWRILRSSDPTWNHCQVTTVSPPSMSVLCFLLKLLSASSFYATFSGFSSCLFLNAGLL